MTIRDGYTLSKASNKNPKRRQQTKKKGLTAKRREVKSRRLSEVIGFARPVSVANDRGFLKYTWSRPVPVSAANDRGTLKALGILKTWQGTRRYKPQLDLLFRFRDLKSDSDICKFAGKYGPLHGGDSIETIDDWRKWVKIARAIINSGVHLTLGRTGSVEDWLILRAWLGEYPAEAAADPEGNYTIRRGIVAGSLQKWIIEFGGTGLGLGVDWSGKLLRLSPNPPNNLGAYFGLAMVEWIGSPSRDTIRCAHCGDQFVRRTNGKYCQACRRSPIPARVRQQKHRERAKGS